MEEEEVAHCRGATGRGAGGGGGFSEKECVLILNAGRWRGRTASSAGVCAPPVGRQLEVLQLRAGRDEPVPDAKLVEDYAHEQEQLGLELDLEMRLDEGGAAGRGEARVSAWPRSG